MENFKVMKLFLLGLLYGIGVASTQNSGAVTDSFHVSGNCDQCKKRIELAAGNVNGVRSAVWSESTLMLTVQYDTQAVALSAVHHAVAMAGHDTDKEKAPTPVYNKLPECCKYERAGEEQGSKKKNIRTVQFHITGMTCAEGCAKGIEGALYRKKGVKSSEVDFEKQVATVIYDQHKISKEALVKIIESFNPGEGGAPTYHAEEVR